MSRYARSFSTIFRNVLSDIIWMSLEDKNNLGTCGEVFTSKQKAKGANNIEYLSFVMHYRQLQLYFAFYKNSIGMNLLF